MADLFIKGISDVSAPHNIHITNVGLNGAKKDFSAWDSSVGCSYEVVEVPTQHGRLIDEDLLIADIRENSASYFADDFADEWTSKQPTVIEASEVEHES